MDFIVAHSFFALFAQMSFSTDSLYCLLAVSSWLSSLCADLCCPYSWCKPLAFYTIIDVIVNVGLVVGMEFYRYYSIQTEVNKSCDDFCGFVQIRLMEGVPVCANFQSFNTVSGPDFNSVVIIGQWRFGSICMWVLDISIVFVKNFSVSVTINILFQTQVKTFQYTILCRELSKAGHFTVLISEAKNKDVLITQSWLKHKLYNSTVQIYHIYDHIPDIFVIFGNLHFKE